MGRVILCWSEHAAYGPEVQFLISAADMGEVREVVARAALIYGPPDRRESVLGRADPLAAIAAAHPGQLLWRLAGEADWRVGAEAARTWRESDIERVNDTMANAAARRRHRRHGRRPT